MAKRLTKFDFDLVVIGSGAAGSVAAETVAATGRRVALVEAATFGGYVPNFGDIPRHALLNAAHIFAGLRAAERFGLRTNSVGYSFPSLKNWESTVIRRSGAARTAEYLRSKNIMVYRGRAHFISRNEISIGQQRHISAAKFLVATGSQPQVPHIQGLENVNYLTAKTALTLNRPPKSLVIVGAGASGVELAESFAIFGTKVYLVERAPRILPKFDVEVSNEIGQLLHKKYSVDIITSAQVVSAANDDMMVRLQITRGGVVRALRVEQILLVTGATPNTDIGLVNAGVKFDNHGASVNQFLQTTSKNIYAVGDVIGPDASDVATAIRRSQIAGYNLTNRDQKSISTIVAPRVAWTDPAVATVGATEEELAARRIKYRVSLVKNSVTMRANITDAAPGLTKLIIGARGQILGATIISKAAVDQIGQITLAMQNNLSLQQLADVIQPFGAWSETLALATADIKRKGGE